MFCYEEKTIFFNDKIILSEEIIVLKEVITHVFEGDNHFYYEIFILLHKRFRNC